MTEFIKAIRSWANRPSRLGLSVGCAIILACATADSSSAQVVQIAGEQPAAEQSSSAILVGNSGTRISSRRLLAPLPQDNKLDASPSDVKGVDAKGKNKAADDKKDLDNDESEKDSDSATKKDSPKPVTPAQSAELSLSVDPVNIATSSIGTGMLPENTAAKRSPASSGLMNGQARGIPVTQVCWKPANICHLPLYFEDAMLERHGHVRWGHAQPIVSGAKFLTTMPLLPYLKTLHPPCEYRYQLGHFRPGTCAPALKDHLPWDRRAAVVETVSLGAFFWAAPL